MGLGRRFSGLMSWNCQSKAAILDILTGECRVVYIFVLSQYLHIMSGSRSYSKLDCTHDFACFRLD